MRLFVVALAGLCFAACSSGPEVPPLPALVVDDYSDELRQAVEKAHAAASADPESAALSGQMGMLLHANDRCAEAIPWYERARALNATEFTWAYGEALCAREGEELGAGLEAAKAALEADAGYVPARLLEAELLLEAGDAEAAESAFAQLTAQEPGVARAWFGFGNASEARGNAVAARAAWGKALDVAPTYGAAILALARSLEESGAAEAAVSRERAEQYALRTPALEDPVLEEIQQLAVSARRLIERADRVVREGDLVRGAELLERAARLEPDNPRPQINLIALYGQMGDMERAEAAFQAALAVEPNAKQAYYNYGVLWVQRDDAVRARKAFEEVLRRDPRDAAAHLNVGYLDAADGRMSAAIGHFRTAAAERPGFREAHFQAGRALVSVGRPREAVAELRAAAEGDPDQNSPRILASLGLALALTGDMTGGRAALERGRVLAAELEQPELAEQIGQQLETMPK